MTIKHTLLSGAAAMALAFSGSAALAQQQGAEQCRQDLQQLNQQVEQARQQEGWQPSSEWRQDYRQLHDAAMVFAERGDEEACSMMVSQMQSLFQERQQAMTEEERQQQQTEEEQQLANATPVAERQGLMRSNTIVGADVRNMQNEELGTIESLVMDPQEGNIAYVLLAHGGFLGMGEEWIPVRWSDLRVTQDGDIFVLNVSEDALEQAPTIEEGAFDPEAGEDWRTQIDSFWSEHTPG